MNRTSAILLLILVGLLWSTGGFLIKLVPWSGMVTAGLRSGFAALIIYLYSKPKNLTFSRYSWYGGLCYTIMVICFVLANKMTNAGNVILIQYAAPAYVALFSFSFIGEKSTKTDWLAICIIFLGLGCFFIDDISLNQIEGNIVAVFSGLGFAGLVLFMRKEKERRPNDSVFLGNLMTFFFCSPLYHNEITLKLEPWLIIIFLGIIQLGIAYILFSIAIKYVSAIDAIIYPVIEPIFNPILAFVFIGENMGSISILGGLMIVFGVVSRSILQNK